MAEHPARGERTARRSRRWSSARSEATPIGHFDVAVANDGVAHIHQRLAHAALEMMEWNTHTEIVAAGELRL